MVLSVVAGVVMVLVVVSIVSVDVCIAAVVVSSGVVVPERDYS